MLAAAERASKLFRAQRSWFLINGSTGGIHIALQALTKAYYARNKARSSTVPTFLISRDAHKSVLGGIELAGARALILPSEIDPIFAVPLGPRLETLLETIRREGSDLAGVVLTRPSYQGLAATSTTISLIADTCHQYDVPLLVDEAHGAHLNFLNNPALLSAVDCGADLVVQSAHKGLTSLTQTGLLHLGRGNCMEDKCILSLIYCYK